jgi:hypothetical protein
MTVQSQSREMRLNFDVYFEFDGTRTMNLSQNTSWFIGIFAFVALFTGSSMLTSDMNDQPGMNQFSDLTDSDIDMILAVKAEMQEAKIESN